MPDYIEREAFKKEVLRLSTHYLNEWDTLGVLAAVDRVPSADVAPVRRGHYIVDDMGDSICSECGEPYLDITMNFCPWCGAKMDQKEELQC